MLHHFELLIITEKLEKLNFFILKTTEIVCTCTTSPAKGLSVHFMSKFTCTKSGVHFLVFIIIVPVLLFHFLSGCALVELNKLFSHDCLIVKHVFLMWYGCGTRLLGYEIACDVVFGEIF